MKKKRAVFYGRVSSEKEMQLNAFENQLKWYDDLQKKLEEEDKYEFTGTRYVDKGITGTAARKRPAFMKMIEDARKGEFDLIITREVARFARNTEESILYTRQLAECNVEVYFVNDNIYSMDPEQNLRLQLMSMIAQEESRRDSERAKAGLYIARQNDTSVWGNGNILGYSRPDGRGGAFVIEEEQAETVRMIKDMYLYEDMGLTDIKIRLEQLGRKTSKGTTSWYVSTISRILDNSFYAGKQRLCQTKVENYLEQKPIKQSKDQIMYKNTNAPTLFSWEEYELIQEKKAARTVVVNDRTVGKKEVKHFWNTKLVCACGSTYAGQNWRQKKDGINVGGYRCNNQRLNRSKSVRAGMGLDISSACDLESIPEWKIDMMAKYVMERVWENRGNDMEEAFEIIKECYKPDKIADESELKNINKQISKYSTRIANLKEMRMDGDIGREEYKMKVAECEENIAVYEAQKKKIEESVGWEFNIDKQLEAIKRSLRVMVDTSGPVIDKKILNRFVDIVYHESPYHYKWFLNLNDSKEALIPEESQIRIVKKNGFKPDIIVKDARKKLFEHVISFEEAKEYRKSRGEYIRKNAWDDIIIEIYA